MQNETNKITKRDIKSMLPEELSKALGELGEPAFRAKQIFKWLWSGVRSFDEMLNIPKSLRSKLDDIFFITCPVVEKKQVSHIDGTIKYLWRLGDGNCVESVVMHYEHGNTVCVSSQVGCAMGCAFCASTIGGRVRNLAPSEILDQVMYSQLDSGDKISNIVMMGIGEPLDNFDSVIKFLTLVNNPDGLNIGMRHISLSTCGLTEKVDKLAGFNLQLTLSVSLHAPDDETRSKIMPVNKAYGVDKVLEACIRYFKRTGRRISFEYAMIDGVNDTRDHAELLASKLKGTGCHVNLIPLNEVEESALHPSKPENLKQFISILQKHGINVTVRRKLGPDINASCGQLRRKREIINKEKSEGKL
ncbi:MAG: 23S rRNA (adenine(2503)-C(2))-methyltransferase RlmN [Oscillospiraceae bacterium]